MLIFSRRDVDVLYPELKNKSDEDVLRYLQNNVYKEYTVILELYTVNLYFVYTTKYEVDRAMEIIRERPINFRAINNNDNDDSIYHFSFKSACGVVRNVNILADMYHRVS